MHSLFFRHLEPEGGWIGQREAMPALQRARMFDAVTRAVAAKGYARMTVADVVGIAGVSRRTFYEQFTDKEDCFLAAYRCGCEALIGNIVDASLAVGPEAGWREVLEAAIESYLATLADDPEFARVFLVDVMGAGPEAARLRRDVLQQFVDQYAVLSYRAAREEPDLAEVRPIYLEALVGGIAELVQRHILDNEASTLPELQPVLVQLVTAVILGAGRTAAAA